MQTRPSLELLVAVFLQFTGRRSQHLRLACRTPLKPDPAHRGPLPILPAPPPTPLLTFLQKLVSISTQFPFLFPKDPTVVLGLLDSVQGVLLWILMEP